MTLNGPVDLRRIAEWAGVPADDIRALNPELRRWTTPVRDSAYEVRVPAGTAAAVSEAHRATAPEEAASLQWYAVRKGESLATIARKLRVSRTDLAEANFLRTTAKVRPGQKLVVPRAPSPAMLARRNGTTPAAAADRDRDRRGGRRRGADTTGLPRPPRRHALRHRPQARRDG